MTFYTSAKRAQTQPFRVHFARGTLSPSLQAPPSPLSHPPCPLRQMQPFPEPRVRALAPSRQPGVTLKFYTIIPVQNSLRPNLVLRTFLTMIKKCFKKGRVLIGLRLYVSDCLK